MTASIEGLSKMPLGDGGVDWRTYKFNLDNTMSLLRICGKSAEERAVAAAMQKIIVVLGDHGGDNMEVVMGEIAASVELKGADRFFYSVLALSTTGKALDIVKQEEGACSGATAWAKLRRRFAEVGTVSFREVLKFEWKGEFETLWRRFVGKVRHLPTKLDDGVLETLVIEGCREGGAEALEQALRLAAPQAWISICGQVDRYLDTMRCDNRGTRPVPMDISAVQNNRGQKVAYGGKGGKSCWKCGRQGHIESECWAKTQKGRGKGGNKGKGYAKTTCFNCKGAGHIAANCTSKKVMCVEDDTVSDGCAVERWVLQVASVNCDESRILVDSGAAVHCCPPKFAAKYGVPTGGPTVKLRAAGGEEIPSYGHSLAVMRSGNNELKVKFVVSEVTQPILSVGALQQAGCQVIFDEQEAYIAHGNKRLRLSVDNGLYYVVANMQRASNEHRHRIEDEYEASWVNVAVANADGNENRNDKRQNDAVENEDDDKENEGDDNVGEDAQQLRVLLPPKEPTEEARAKHAATHLPYQPWCMACVCGRGVAAQHRSKKNEVGDSGDEKEAVVQFDYGFVDGRTYCAAICTKTNYMMARFVDDKSTSDFAVRSFAKFVKHLGHAHVCLQSDAEPGIVAVLMAVQQAVCQGSEQVRQVRVRNTGGFASASNGAVERAHGMLKGMLRTIMYEVAKKAGEVPGTRSQGGVRWTSDEDRTKRREDESVCSMVDVYHGLTDWGLRHAAWLLNMCHVARKDKKTGYQRLTGNQYDSIILGFLSPVVWLDERPEAKRKLEPRQAAGLWIGRLTESNHHLVLLQNGDVVSARTVRAVSKESFEQETRMAVTQWVAKLKDSGVRAAGAAQAKAVLAARIPGNGIVMEARPLTNQSEEPQTEEDRQGAKRDREDAQIMRQGGEESASTKRMRVTIVQNEEKSDAKICAIEVPQKHIDPDDVGW